MATNLADIIRVNRQMHEELYESFNNRNSTEVKQTGHAAVDNNIRFLSSAATKTGYSAEATFTDFRTFAEGKDLSRGVLVDLDEFDGQRLTQLLILLISRIERYERDFSSKDDELPEPLQKKGTTPHATHPLYADLYSTSKRWRFGSAETRFDDLWDVWQRSLRLVLSIVEARSFADIDPDVQQVAHYYFLFRGVREDMGSFSTAVPLARKLEECEHLLRSALFLHLSTQLRPSLTSRLQRAMIYRNLGCETGYASYLDQAASDHIDILGHLDEVVREHLSPGAPDRASDDAIGQSCASYFSRLMNDIGRVVETLGVMMQRLDCGLDMRMPLDPVFVRVDEYAAKWPPTDTTPTSDIDLINTSSRAKRLRELLFECDPPDDEGRTCREYLRQARDGLMQVAGTKTGSNRHEWPKRVESLLEDMAQPLRPGDPPPADWQQVIQAAEIIFGLVEPETTLRQMMDPPVDGCDEISSGRGYVTLHNRGRVRARLQKHQDAVDDYKRVLAVQPGFAPAHENLAMTLIQLGEFAVAERHFKEAQRLYLEDSNRRLDKLDVNLGEVIVAERMSQRELHRYLTQRSCLGTADELIILKRWNSYTPALPSKPRSLGGGYFLMLSGQGIVIDPGYDFVYNFGRAGFSVNDIDVIAITHLHMDHVEDLENLLLLLFERQKRTGIRSRRLKLVVSESVRAKIHCRLNSLLADRDLWTFIDYIVPPTGGPGDLVRYRWRNVDSQFLSGERLVNLAPRSSVKVWTTRSDHVCQPDHPASVSEPSNGFIFQVTQEHDGEKYDYRVGFTADTRWFPELREQFDSCDVVVAHLGQVYTTDVDAAGYIQSPRPYMTQRNHLGLSGVYHLFAPDDGVVRDADTRSRLLILGEFGEEVGAHRVRVSEKLRQAFAKRGLNVHVLAGDLGLRLRLGKTHSDGDTKGKSVRVRCDYCGASSWRPFYEMRDIIVDSAAAKDDAIRYYCSRHHPSHIFQREASLVAHHLPRG